MSRSISYPVHLQRIKAQSGLLDDILVGTITWGRGWGFGRDEELLR